MKFDRRVEHGMTHSLYIHDPNGYGVELLYELPREVWEGDIDGALNFAVPVPTEGAEALEDRTEDVPVFGTATPWHPEGGTDVEPSKHQRRARAPRESDPERQPDRQHRHVERDQRHQPGHARAAAGPCQRRWQMCSLISATTSRRPAAASTTSSRSRSG